METIILSLGLILLSVLGLSIGVIMGRGPVRGSCGGVSCIKGAECGGCTARRSEDARS